jgi:predicted DNA-binding ribbon-helix-helix protein
MSLISRNIIISGRRTSVRLEQQMWGALHDIARREKCSVHDICSLVNVRKRKDSSLTAAIRVFIMLYFRTAETEEGHVKAGHGDFRSMEERAKLDKHADKQYYKRSDMIVENC